MKNIVITGGAGFIGSHLVDYFVDYYSSANVTVIDKMTYAADFKNISHHLKNNKFKLRVGDICDFDFCYKTLQNADLLIHAAAESHVDNSFHSSLTFSRTNVLGTHSLMQAAIDNRVSKIIHISTDEVYGEIIEGSVNENAVFSPTNPYSASKAAAEMIVFGYIQSYKLPAIIVRANNMFGTRQFPEKLIPKSIMHLLSGDKIMLHGNGLNKRTFLAVNDFCEAINLLIKKGNLGEAYNIGTQQEYQNVEIARMLCDLFELDYNDYITYVDDRPFNDLRYCVDYSKILKLGWTPKVALMSELRHLIAWYKERRYLYEFQET